MSVIQGISAYILLIITFSFIWTVVGKWNNRREESFWVPLIFGSFLWPGSIVYFMFLPLIKSFDVLSDKIVKKYKKKNY